MTGREREDCAGENVEKEKVRMKDRTAGGQVFSPEGD